MAYKRLKDMREDRNITQQKIADFLHISRSAYQNYESGIRGIPVEILSLTADFYNTSVDYLIERTDVKTSYPLKSKNK